jgi:hypothetical protein
MPFVPALLTLFGLGLIIYVVQQRWDRDDDISLLILLIASISIFAGYGWTVTSQLRTMGYPVPVPLESHQTAPPVTGFIVLSHEAPKFAKYNA